MIVSTTATMVSATSRWGRGRIFSVDDMDPSPLKAALKQCSEKPLKKTDFSIGHRGAGLQFPEHTKESTKRPRAWARVSSSVM